MFRRNFMSSSKNWIKEQDGRFVAKVTKDLQTLNFKFDQVIFNSLVLTWEENLKWRLVFSEVDFCWLLVATIITINLLTFLSIPPFPQIQCWQLAANIDLGGGGGENNDRYEKWQIYFLLGSLQQFVTFKKYTDIFSMIVVAGCWLLVAGCWLLVAGCWLLVAGCWLLVAS